MRPGSVVAVIQRDMRTKDDAQINKTVIQVGARVAVIYIQKIHGAKISGVVTKKTVRLRIGTIRC